jgi:hypothetical protein
MERAILLEVSLFSLNQKIYILENNKVVKEDLIPNEAVAKTIYDLIRLNHTRVLKIHGNKLYSQRFLKGLRENYTANIKVEYI